MHAMKNIRVVEYDPAWPGRFQEEANQFVALFGEELVAIHHIGSTSVPGLAAKPVIDIMPLVRDIEQVDSFNEPLAQLGYEAWGENGIAGRRYFSKGGDYHRTHNVHIYEPSNPEVVRHLAFRDYLRAHADEVQRYAQLKRTVAQQFPDDIYGYMDGKDAFIKQMLEQALAWHAQIQSPGNA